MFERLEMAPPDAILGLTEAFKKDPRPEKITVPSAVATTGVPIALAISIPSWIFPHRGPNRDVTTPFVGQIEG